MSDNTERNPVVETTKRVWKCGKCSVETDPDDFGFLIGYPAQALGADDLRDLARAMLAAADAVDPQDGGAE